MDDEMEDTCDDTNEIQHLTISEERKGTKKFPIARTSLFQEQLENNANDVISKPNSDVMRDVIADKLSDLMNKQKMKKKQVWEGSSISLPETSNIVHMREVLLNDILEKRKRRQGWVGDTSDANSSSLSDIEHYTSLVGETETIKEFEQKESLVATTGHDSDDTGHPESDDDGELVNNLEYFIEIMTSGERGMLSEHSNTILLYERIICDLKCEISYLKKLLAMVLRCKCS